MSSRSTQTASHWGVFNVETDAEGNILGTTAFARDPNPSAINRSLPDMVRSDLRIDQPYIREGYLRHRAQSRDGRGADRFVAVTWDHALGLVEEELRRVKERFGNEAIYGGSYGWASAGRLHHSPSVLKRFLGLNGGYVDKLGNHSFGAALHIMPYVIGRGDIPSQAMPWSLIVSHSELVVMFGGANPKNVQIDSGGVTLHEAEDWFRKAKAAGIEFINISPSQRDGMAVDARWLPIRPNTDVALLLGLAHTLASEGLHNVDFLNRFCTGYARFERYLMGGDDNRPKSAEWAESITGIAADTIKALARRMAAKRTLITTSWSVQRGDHGEQPVWMSVVLAAMLGQIGLLGGGFTIGLSASNGIGGSRPPNMPRPTLPLGPNAVTNHIPVGRVTQMLLNPGGELAYNGKTIRFPDIRLIYSAGGNPFHHNTNLNRFVQGWRKPETVIVHEPWWTPAAKFADIVLPATTTMERNDIQASEYSRFYIAMRKVIEPVGLSRNDFDIFAELSERLGFGSAYTEGRNEMGWLEHMYEGARAAGKKRDYELPPFQQFWSEGVFEFPMGAEPRPLLADFREDPAAHPLRTPSGKIEIYSETIESFNYDDCPPHPVWMEPAEWLGAADTSRHPIHLLSIQPTVRLHSQLDPAPISRASKVHGREQVYLGKQDGESRGLKDGMIVRVFNDRGAFLAAVKICDHLRPGVAQIATGAWYDPLRSNAPAPLENHGNPNVVTLDKGTSKLGQSSAAQTVLVEIERYLDPQPVTAFERPAMSS